MCTPVFVRVELILILCRIEFWVLLFQKKPKNREKEEKEEKRKERTPQNKHFLCCPTTQTNKQQARIYNI
jgi:hypothetical protein